jgi:hypothetical protein
VIIREILEATVQIMDDINSDWWTLGFEYGRGKGRLFNTYGYYGIRNKNNQLVWKGYPKNAPDFMAVGNNRTLKQYLCDTPYFQKWLQNKVNKLAKEIC